MAGTSYRSMDGKQCVFFVQKAGKRSLFSETLAGTSTLTQWIPCRKFGQLLCLLSSTICYFGQKIYSPSNIVYAHARSSQLAPYQVKRLTATHSGKQTSSPAISHVPVHRQPQNKLFARQDAELKIKSTGG